MHWIARLFRRRCKDWYSMKWKPGCGYYDGVVIILREDGGATGGGDSEI